MRQITTTSVHQGRRNKHWSSLNSLVNKRPTFASWLLVSKLHAPAPTQVSGKTDPQYSITHVDRQRRAVLVAGSGRKYKENKLIKQGNLMMLVVATAATWYENYKLVFCSTTISYPFLNPFGAHVFSGGNLNKGPRTLESDYCGSEIHLQKLSELQPYFLHYFN